MELLKLKQKTTELKEKITKLLIRKGKLQEEIYTLRNGSDQLYDFKRRALLGTLEVISQLANELRETGREGLRLISKMETGIETGKVTDELLEEIDIQFAKVDESLLKIQTFVEAGKQLIPPETKPEDEDE